MKARFPGQGKHLRIGSTKVKINSTIVDISNGHVYNCTDSRGREYALKAIGISSKKLLKNTIIEHRFHTQVSGAENIVAVHDCLVDRDAHIGYLLMELCENNLRHEIRSHSPEPFTNQEIIDIFQSICSAVHHLHSQSPPIMHRNVTIDNILLSSNGWKLSDFGSAATLCDINFSNSSKLKAIRAEFDIYTPLPYRAPETIDLRLNRPLTPKVDVWALGCLLYKLCTFKDAFSDSQQILTGTYVWPPELEINEQFKEIVSIILNPNPELRPSAAQVLGHLYAAFPSVVNPKWKAYSPASKAPALVARARSTVRIRVSRSGDDPGSTSVSPRLSIRKQRHQVVSLGSGVSFADLEAARLSREVEANATDLYALLQEQFAGQKAGSRQGVRIKRSS